ncbi:MAG: hypothetical protein ACREER_08635, partial [Alphaproteobacteria bacterium]
MSPVRLGRRAVLVGFGWVGFGWVLAGCGFQPVYGRRDPAGAALAAELAAVAIDPVAAAPEDSRVGQI